MEGVPYLCELKGGQRSGLLLQGIVNRLIPPNEVLIPSADKKLEGSMIGRT